MSNRLNGVIQRFRSRAEDQEADAELLERYSRAGDEGAFAVLVERHGGLVLGVAQRQLADRQQAEDVFQATFLALARSAARLGRRATLTNWLYTVALRQARKARIRNARREILERDRAPRPDVEPDPLEEMTGRELLRVLDEELARLPERYRLPVLLCCVRGLSREEAATALGWSEGAVKGRLERGRRRLAQRLTARGLAPSAVLLAPLTCALVPGELLARAADLARAPWSTAVPTEVAVLARTTAPRSLVPVASVTGCLVATALAGWALAVGGKDPTLPARGTSTPGGVAPVARAGDDPPDPLPDGALARFGTTRFRHGTTIQNLSVSADSKLAVAGSGSRRFGQIRTYDLATGRALISFNEKESYVVAVTLSPDGKTVAIKRGDHSVHFHDTTTGRAITQIPYPSANPSSMTEWLTFSPDGKRILVGTAEGKGVHLIDRDKLDVVRTFQHAHVVFAAAFSPDGKLAAAGGYDSEKNIYFARLWNAKTGAELRHFRFGNGGIRSLAFSPDGKTVAIGGDGGRPPAVKVFDVETAKERTTMGYPGASSVRSVAFSPDGKTIAASGGSTTRLFDAATGKEKLRIDRKAIGLQFALDGKSLIGAVSGAIYRWDAATGEVLTPEGGDSVVDQIEVTTEGKRLITRGQDGDAHIWDAATGEHLRRVDVAWQNGLAVSPDGRFLVWPVEDESVKFKVPNEPNITYTGRRLRMLDLQTGKFVERFGGFGGDADDLFFAAGGKTLLTVDHRDATVRLWDVGTGKVERSFRAVRDTEKNRQNHVWHARLSPNEKVLAVTYQPSGRGLLSPFPVRLWDLASGKELHDLVGHQYYVEAMAFSPDGKLFLSGSEPLQEFVQKQLKRPPDQVFVWNVATGEAVARLPIGATAAAFSPNGRSVAVALPDGTIQFWDVATWKVWGEFRGPHGRVTALTFGPDGTLFSGGVEAAVLAWDPRKAKTPPTGPR